VNGRRKARGSLKVFLLPGIGFVTIVSSLFNTHRSDTVSYDLLLPFRLYNIVARQ